MRRTRYRRWDGTQSSPELQGEALAKRLFEELSHYMNWSLTAQEALEWLKRQGLNLPDLDLKVLGTDELLQQLRQHRQNAFQRFNFQKSLDDVRERIARIVELELATARTELGSIHPQFQRREDSLRSLPVRPGEAIARLAEYDADPGFLDAEAKRLFDELLEQQDTVKDLEQFILRYGRQFQGPQSLDFEAAADLMAQFKRLSAMAEGFRSGDLSGIPEEDYSEFLEGESARSASVLSRFAEMLEESGFISAGEERIRLTPKGFRQIGQNALNEIFRSLKKEHFGLHANPARGSSGMKPDSTVPYEHGKTLNLHILNTLNNSIRRSGQLGKIDLQPQDFEVFEEEHETQTTTVLMLDMSWSMSRDGRFPAAKRVALALDHLIRITYPRDHYYTVGFSTRARQLTPERLAEATWDPSDPFTNIQEGLALARQLFHRHRAVNRQVILITDGQPTATHIKGFTNAQWPGFMGSIPPDIYRDTLKEVDTCTREKVVINVFMLDDNPVLTRFVEEIVRINRGRAFYSLPQNLGRYLLVDYISRRRTRVG